MQQNANELQTVSADHNSVNELVVIYRSILRHKWPIIGLTLAVVAIVFSILQAVTPIYQSSAKIIIEQENAKVLNVEELFNIRQSKEYFNSQIGIIKSRETMLRVIKELKLWNVPEFDPRNQSKEKDKIETLLDRIGIHLDQNTQEVHPNIERLSDDRLAELVVSKFEKGCKLSR